MPQHAPRLPSAVIICPLSERSNDPAVVAISLPPQGAARSPRCPWFDIRAINLEDGNRAGRPGCGR